MDITHKNIGDVLCLYSTAECICITDVKGHHVYYDKEYGSSYMTTAQTADAFFVTDPDRLAFFDQNRSLGKVLLHAELSAMNDLLSTDCTEQEIQAASKSLETTRQHLHHLYSRIDAYRAVWTAGISNAQTFLADLMEHKNPNVFWGIPVSHFKAPDGRDMFSVNGQSLHHDQATAYLGAAHYQEPEYKPRLIAQIRSAHSRRNRNPFELEPAQIHHYIR